MVPATRSPTPMRSAFGAGANGRLRALEHRSVSLPSPMHEFV